MKKWKAYDFAQVALLACFIAISGSFKLPTGIPGSEFQLSAPIAVAIAAVFGFTRYITAGIIASILLFFLGLHNLLNIEIAMVFRLVTGGIVSLFGSSLPILLIAGPAGSAAARWVLSLTLDTPFTPLLLSALPGMIFTAATAWPLTRLLQRVKNTVRRQQHVEKHSSL